MLKKLEENVVKEYTIQSFKRVQEELKKESLFSVISSRTRNVEQEYVFREYDKPKINIVVYSTIGRQEIRCSCLYLETTGLSCCHALHVVKWRDYNVFQKI